MSANDRKVPLVTTLLGAVAALVAVVTVGVFLEGWTLRRMAGETRTKVIERPYPELETYRREQEQRLSADFYWLDQEAGRVHLPIDRAMALLVEERGPAAETPGEQNPGEQNPVQQSPGEPQEAAP